MRLVRRFKGGETALRKQGRNSHDMLEVFDQKLPTSGKEKGGSMQHIILVGKGKDVFKELKYMLKLQTATGYVLLRYQPKLKANSQN